MLGALLFLIYIKDMDSDIVNELLQFTDYTKIFGRVEDEFDRDRLQKDTDMIISWSHK